MAGVTLSVVVATRDRPEDLARCLAALAAQTEGGSVEVVVVDDGSVCEIETIVRRCVFDGVPAVYVRQDGGGAASARDRGTAVATADLLAYLDDDAIPSPGWADALITAFSDWGCDAIAGRIILRLLGPAPDWLRGPEWRALSELDLGSKPLWLAGRTLPFSANCAVTRVYFERVGGFAVGGVGRTDRTLATGEDTWFFRQVKNLGGSIAYAPEACIQHVVRPQRLTRDWFVQRAIAQGASVALLRLGHERSLVRRILLALREVLRLVLRLPAEIARDALCRRGTVGTRLFLAYERGALTALWRRRSPPARESL